MPIFVRQKHECFYFFYKSFDKFTQNLIVEFDQTCSVANFLANGIPDYPISGDFDTFSITGSIKTSINQFDGSTYRLGDYSHTTDGVSYYTNGDDTWCGSARQAQITWYCGDTHIELTSATEPTQCEYHFELEINCCHGMEYII